MARNIFATQPAPTVEEEAQPAQPAQPAQSAPRRPVNIFANNQGAQTSSGKGSLPEGVLDDVRQKDLESRYSKLDSAMLGAADSAALGFSDEIAGGAAGLWGAVQDPMNFGQRFSEGYDATTKSVRQMQEEASEANPWSYGGGQLLGAVPSMFVGGAGLRGAGLVGKTLIGARNAAVEGGIYGVGSGENLEDRLYRGAAGAATGAALGALPGAVGAAYTYGAKPAASGVANVVGGIFNPAGRAETLVAKSLRADAKSAAQTGTEMLNRSDVGPARARGQEPLVADMGNEVTGRLARAASNSSPEAAALLKSTAQERFNDQGTRIVEHLDNIYGGLNSADVIDSLKAQADAVVKPLYQRAMNDPRGRSLYTAELDNMLQSPAVQRAIDKAEERSAELAVAQGVSPVKNPFARDANGRLVLNNQATGATPSLAFWDVVKRNLDDEVNALYRAGNKDVAKDIKKIRDNMRDHLDTLVPTYQYARGAAAHYFKANDAFEAGQKFASQTKEADISSAMKFVNGLRADPARAGELDLFERGFMSAYSGKLDGMPKGRDLSKVIMGSGTDRKKLNAAVAPQRLAEIESMAKVERIMDRLRRQTSGGSNTTQQLLDLGIGAGAGYYTTGDFSGAALGAAALRGTHFAANKRLMGEVSKLLASGAPQDIAKVSKMAAKNPAVASFIENVGNKLGTVQREVVAPVGAALASDAAARPEIDVPGGDLPEQGYKFGGAVDALTKVAKKAMKTPKPKLEGEELIADWEWRPEKEVADELGLQDQPIPDHVQAFGHYMKGMSDKAGGQGLSKRDLVKAFGITRASIQRGAVKADKLKAGGFDIPNAGDKVRPEGAMAEWYFTPMGQRYLDNAEKGVIDEEAIADFQAKFKPFGKADKDVPDFMRGAVTTFDDDYVKQLSDLVARGANGSSTPEEWRAATERLRGIGPAKKGFIASLLGRGDQPTPDARQLVLQTGRPSKEASKFMGRRGGKGGDAAVQRLTERQRNLNMKLPSELDPYYQHLTHHTIWDKVAGEKTTHEDIIRAMRLAAMAGLVPAGVASQYTKALEDEQSGVQTFSKGGLAQLAESVGGIPFSGGSKGGVARAAMNFVTRALGTNDISETTLADIARMHNITPEQLATGYSALEHGAKSKKTGQTRDVVRNWSFKTSQDAQPLLEREAFNPNEMRVGDVWIPMHGDRTSLGTNIHEVEDVPLVSPTRTSGGVDFMLSDHQQQEGAMWRSDPNVITSLNNKADNAANVSRRIYGRDPNVYAAFINMGKRSGDYSGQPLDVAANMIPNMNISKDAIGAYNKKMEEFVGEKNASRTKDYDKSVSSYEKKRANLQARFEKEMVALEKEKKPERRAQREERVAAVAQKMDALTPPTLDALPQWPGIENRLDLLHMIQQPTQGIGEVRKYATQLMDMPDFFDAGFPNMGAVRLATTKPELAAMDDYSHTGWMIGKREGSGSDAVDRNPLLYHPSYAHNWKGRPGGGLAAALTDREFFNRWAKLFKRRLGDKNDSPQAFYKSLANRRAYQLVDQEFIDKLAALEEAARSRR